MKKLFKTSLLALFMLFAFNLTYSQNFEFHTFEHFADHINGGGGAYNTVTIWSCADEMNPTYSELACLGAGSTPCEWGSAQHHHDLCDYGDGIITRRLYERGQVYDMFTYAKTEAQTGNHVGVHNSNITYFPTGATYYRTVEWNYDPLTEEFQVTVSVLEQE